MAELLGMLRTAGERPLPTTRRPQWLLDALRRRAFGSRPTEKPDGPTRCGGGPTKWSGTAKLCGVSRNRGVHQGGVEH